MSQHCSPHILACYRTVHEHCMEFGFLVPTPRDHVSGSGWNLGKLLGVHNQCVLFISFLHMLLCMQHHTHD